MRRTARFSGAGGGAHCLWCFLGGVEGWLEFTLLLAVVLFIVLDMEGLLGFGSESPSTVNL